MTQNCESPKPPSATPLEIEIKQLLIDTLALEDLNPNDIGSDQTLFGQGQGHALSLGLDSVDALELGVALGERYGIKMNEIGGDAKNQFANVRSLAALISQHRTK